MVPRPNISRKAFAPLWRQLISWVLILMQIVMKYGHNFIVLSKQTRFHLYKDRISMRKSPFRFTRSHCTFRSGYNIGSEAAPTEPRRNRVGTESEPSRDRVGTESETRRNRVGTASEPSRNRVGTESEPSRNRVGTASEPSRNRVGTESEPSRNRVGTESEPSRNRVGTESEPSRNWVGTASGTCWPQKGPL